MLHLPCLTAVDGFSLPDLTCALARCREDASNWAAFIYNTSCSTCLGRKKSNLCIKIPFWMHSSQGQTSLFNHTTPQDPATAEKEDRCLKCSSTLPSLPFTNTLSWGEGTSAHLGAAAAKTNCFKCRHLRKEHLFVGTLPEVSVSPQGTGCTFHFLSPWNSQLWKANTWQGFSVGFLLLQEEGRK